MPGAYLSVRGQYQVRTRKIAKNIELTLNEKEKKTQKKKGWIRDRWKFAITHETSH